MKTSEANKDMWPIWDQRQKEHQIKMDYAHRCFQEIYNWAKSNDEKPVEWIADSFYYYFSNGYNPEKGETPVSEKEKWVKFLREVHSVGIMEDELKRSITFYKIPKIDLGKSFDKLKENLQNE